MTGEIITMAINYSRIAEKIRKIRKLKKLTQADLAEMTGFAVSHISHLEIGRKKVSLDALVRIANALGVTVDHLLEGNQIWDDQEYKSELLELLADCTPYEKAVIYSCAIDTKQRLREYADLFYLYGLQS
jgi:transcriptional regulator with XRE-family HTH domain